MRLTESQARDALRALLDDYHKLTTDQRQTMSEASVVRQFIDRLLAEVLGWPIKDPDRYKYELHTQAGRPDMTLLPERGGTIFVEAKRFGAIRQLAQARNTIAGTITPGQLALPGMSADRTAEEQQAINYAFANGGTWAILTNFEKLRLFNARRDWLVLSFEDPAAYLREFDLLWQLAYHNVVSGSLDRLSNQRHTEEVDSAYLEFINLWREKLAQDILTRGLVNLWLYNSDGSVNLPRLRAVVQRFLDRMVIVRFAEDHLVIPPRTLWSFYELGSNNIYFALLMNMRYFFRRFDQHHNSALFALDDTDRVSFGDKTLLPLIEKLYEARYRAMPADIIGNTYEQYLGKTLALHGRTVVTRDNLETRKKQGSYYTPQVIVRYIVDHSLGRYLYATADGSPDGEPIPGQARKTSADIRDLRVLDSACGSGSFLIYAYNVLADFYEGEIARLEREGEQRRRELAASGTISPLELQIQLTPYLAELERIRNYPRLILEQHLYGVDLDAQAAEIAVVNLLMRAMERRTHEKRLPMVLGQNVKVGNALVGLRPDDPRLASHADTLTELIRLRALLTTDPDKDAEQPEPENEELLTRTLDEIREIPNPAVRERARALLAERLAHFYADPAYDNRVESGPPPDDPAHKTYYETVGKTRALAAVFDADFAAHFSDLHRARPFHWGVEFPEVFYNADGTLKDNPGFTIIVGNPPWEILKPDLREFYAQFDDRLESRLNRQQADARIAELDAEDPARRAAFDALNTSIAQTVGWLRASADYTRQGRGDPATHKLFTERGYAHLLADGGRLGYVVPSGIYTDLGTKELRELMFTTGTIEYLYGLANVRGFFKEVDSRFKFTLLGIKKGGVTERFRTLFLLSHAEWPQITPERDGMAILQDVLYDERRYFNITVDSVRRFSPDSLSVMEFQSARDYAIAERIYADHPLLGQSVPGAWHVKFTNEFHMTNDRALFRTAEQVRALTGHDPSAAQGFLPLYEGKMIHQYDAFFAAPQYWVAESEGRQSLANTQAADWYTGYRFAFREVARGTDERTCIAAVLPPYSFAGHTLWVGVAPDAPTLLYYVGMVNSLCVDWLVRFKAGTHVTLFLMKSLPMPRLTAGHPTFDAIVERAARLVCTHPAFDALWAAVMGDAPRPDADSADTVRATLRDEIDALVAHLYGLSRDDFAHILTTFPLVFPETDAGQARRAALLAAYDRLAGTHQGTD